MLKRGKAPYLECSSRGEKRFSAFYARVGHDTIENRYQAAKQFPGGVKGLTWREAKGRRPLNPESVRVLYDVLWMLYIDEHPELKHLLVRQTGLSDMFGLEGHACQADTLWRLRDRYLATENWTGCYSE